jgi:hypothetical protein
MTWGWQTMPYLAACVFYTVAAVLYLKFFRAHDHVGAAPGELAPEAETSA